MNLNEYETPLTDEARIPSKKIVLTTTGSHVVDGEKTETVSTNFARDLERKLALCREHIEAIEAASRVAFMVTTCPIMTDTLAGIGRRCHETLAATEPKQ